MLKDIVGRFLLLKETAELASFTGRAHVLPSSSGERSWHGVQEEEITTPRLAILIRPINIYVFRASRNK